MLSIPSKSLFDFQINLVHNLEQPKDLIQHDVIGKQSLYFHLNKTFKNIQFTVAIDFIF